MWVSSMFVRAVFKGGWPSTFLERIHEIYIIFDYNYFVLEKKVNSVAEYYLPEA